MRGIFFLNVPGFAITSQLQPQCSTISIELCVSLSIANTLPQFPAYFHSTCYCPYQSLSHHFPSHSFSHCHSKPELLLTLNPQAIRSTSPTQYHTSIQSNSRNQSHTQSHRHSNNQSQSHSQKPFPEPYRTYCTLVFVPYPQPLVIATTTAFSCPCQCPLQLELSIVFSSLILIGLFD